MPNACRALRTWTKHQLSRRFSSTRGLQQQIADQADDALLRQVFDAPQSSWRQNLSAKFGVGCGLFNNEYLRSPEGFPSFARDSLDRAEFLAEYVSRCHRTMSSAAVVGAFDRLSDTLCSVLDLAEFVRNSHPDTRYIEAAETAYDILHGFMNTLNTHTGLFVALNEIGSDGQKFNTLNYQQKSVLEVLLADFYRSGVHLDSATRQNFVKLSTEISKAERLAFTDYAPAQAELLLPVVAARGLWPNLNTSLMTANGKSIRVPTSGWEADSAMQKLEVAESRQLLMAASQTARPDQIANLDNLFVARGRLANLVGQESCGDSILAKQMAKSPKQVETFLLNYGDMIRPKARAEYDVLRELKRKHLLSDKPLELNRWDEDYYSALFIRRSDRTHTADLSPYLSIGTVIQGFSRLFEHLYGVRFVATDMQSGESWHPDVRRLNVVSEEDGLIGVLYCDLFSRPGKSSGLAAHFTLRCGRRIDDGELLPGESMIESGMLKGKIRGANYQLPVIALQCSFSPASNNSFSSLTFHEVSTLAHEMGHAIHSMLGTTDYQTISGTRVAADFVELPSQIMESFMESPQVWPLFARHYSTDTPAPEALLKHAVHGTTNLAAIQSYRQFIRALLDQRYHSSLALRDDFDSMQILADLEREFGLTCRSDPTYSWHVQFTHFAGYGGTYYSYMFDKAIADKIWTEIFESDPLSRDAGSNFRDNLLQYGGSRDPWRCLADVLQQPMLASGDHEAMAEVGKWSVKG